MEKPLPDGSLGNLTIDEERKLQEAWVHLLRLSGNENLEGPGALTSTPDLNEHLMQQFKSKSPEKFRRRMWDFILSEHPDVAVLRFLRARKWEVQPSMAMLVADLNWRSDRRIEETIIRDGDSIALKESPTNLEKEFVTQYRSGKSYIRGSDRENRLIYIIRVQKHETKKQSPEVMEQYTLHQIESIRILASYPTDKATLIFDMTSFGFRNMDFHLVQFLCEVFEARYPETLGLVLIHNAPYIFWGFWKIIRPWIDPVIAAKINFTRSNADLESYISKENLQTRYGGDDTWDYKYVEPVPGENDKLQSSEKKAKVQDERYELEREFEKGTIEWLKLDPESEEAQEKTKRRTDVAKELNSNYWKLDPYIRSKTYYHRVGVVDDDGNVDYLAAGRQK